MRILVHFSSLLDGLSKVMPSLPPIDKNVVKPMSLEDEEGHQRKKRKEVVETKEEDSLDDDDDEDWDKAQERGATATRREATTSFQVGMSIAVMRWQENK